MFYGLLRQAKPMITSRRIYLLWTVCRGITDEPGIAKALHDAGFAHSPQTIREDICTLVFNFFGLLPLTRSEEDRTRKQLTQDLLPSLVRAVWGIYDLAWGHPITSRMPSMEQIQEELRETT